MGSTAFLSQRPGALMRPNTPLNILFDRQDRDSKQPMIAGICLMCEAPILLRPVKTITRLVTVMALFSGTVDWLAAAPTGPTLHLDYGQGRPLENPASQFMYFVPLISPDPISVSTNAGNALTIRFQFIGFLLVNRRAVGAIPRLEIIRNLLLQIIFDRFALQRTV